MGSHLGIEVGKAKCADIVTQSAMGFIFLTSIGGTSVFLERPLTAGSHVPIQSS